MTVAKKYALVHVIEKLRLFHNLTWFIQHPEQSRVNCLIYLCKKFTIKYKSTASYAVLKRNLYGSH